MNIGKTEVMLFGTSKRISSQPRPLQVKYRDLIINNTNSYTYLGHVLDNSLTLNEDFDASYKKCTKRVKLMTKLRSYLTQEAAMRIYVSTILPILTYTNMVKLHLTKTQSSKLTSLERRAERIVKQKVPTTENIIKKKMIIFVRRCLVGDVCANFEGYFEMRSHKMNTRNNRFSYLLRSRE